MVEIAKNTTDRLSTFRTEHEFERYAEFTSVEELLELRERAESEGVGFYILGNGSNTLFASRRVKTLVAKNKMPKTVEDLGDGRVRASSSAMVAQLLKICREQRRESCYYLASVPATIGGALAMNAGRGKDHNKTIFDYVETLTYYDLDGAVKTVRCDEVEREYRKTMFTGVQGRCILEASFHFPPSDDDDDQIRKRVEWSKEVQDHSSPNCGSVFKQMDPWVMSKFRRLALPFGGAKYSRKTLNWLLNTSKSSRGLVVLIRLAKLAHRVVGKKAELEFIEVR